MPITARKVVELPQRRLTGTITSSKCEPSQDKRTGKTYEYLNIQIAPDMEAWTPEELSAAEGFNGSIKVSVNSNLSKFTDLGRLLLRLGFAIPNAGVAFDEHTLEGLTVSFDMVRDGNFVNPDPDSFSRVKQ